MRVIHNTLVETWQLRQRFLRAHDAGTSRRLGLRATFGRQHLRRCSALTYEYELVQKC